MFIPITQVTDHLTDKTYKIWIPANVPIQEAIDIQYRNYFRYLGIPPIVWSPPPVVAPHKEYPDGR